VTVPSILHLLFQIHSFPYYAIAYGRKCRLVRLDFIAPLPCVACTLQYCHGHFITVSDYPPPIPLLFYSINIPMFVVELQEIKSPVYLHSRARLSSRLSFPHRLYHRPTYSDPLINSRPNIDIIALSQTSPKNITPSKTIARHRISSLVIAPYLPSLLIIINPLYSPFPYRLLVGP
jgi:hypothetical protein